MDEICTHTYTLNHKFVEEKNPKFILSELGWPLQAGHRTDKQQ